MANFTRSALSVVCLSGLFTGRQWIGKLWFATLVADTRKDDDGSRQSAMARAAGGCPRSECQ